MAASSFADGSIYRSTRGITSSGMDITSSFLFPFGKFNTAGKAITKAEKIARATPLLAKTRQLTGRIFKSNFAQLKKNGWVFPFKGGGAMINGRWYTKHALERMAPRTPEMMAELEWRFNQRAKIASKNMKPKQFKNWYRDNLPNSRGIPPYVVEAEIAYPKSTGVRVELNEDGAVKTVITNGYRRN